MATHVLQAAFTQTRYQVLVLLKCFLQLSVRLRRQVSLRFLRKERPYPA
jgi:hypothetical protein